MGLHDPIFPAAITVYQPPVPFRAVAVALWDHGFETTELLVMGVQAITGICWEFVGESEKQGDLPTAPTPASMNDAEYHLDLTRTQQAQHQFVVFTAEFGACPVDDYEKWSDEIVLVAPVSFSADWWEQQIEKIRSYLKQRKDRQDEEEEQDEERHQQ